jgi:hypothetical protein
MTTWTLIVVIIAQYTGTPTTVYSVPGFQDEAACMDAAGDVYEWGNGYSKEARAACYPTKTSPTGETSSDGKNLRIKPR